MLAIDNRMGRRITADDCIQYTKEQKIYIAHLCVRPGGADVHACLAARAGGRRRFRLSGLAFIDRRRRSDPPPRPRALCIICIYHCNMCIIVIYCGPCKALGVRERERRGGRGAGGS